MRMNVDRASEYSAPSSEGLDSSDFDSGTASQEEEDG